jgi:hypothetical protein
MPLTLWSLLNDGPVISLVRNAQEANMEGSPLARRMVKTGRTRAAFLGYTATAYFYFSVGLLHPGALQRRMDKCRPRTPAG